MALTRDDFEEWLFEMSDRIENLLADLPVEVADQLDYSGRSLDVIEGWLLSRYPSNHALLADTEKDALDQIASYVGEVFRKHLGGNWTIDLDNPKNAYFHIPVLEDKGKWVECPVTLVTAAADRRAGNYFSRILHNYIQRYGKKT